MNFDRNTVFGFIALALLFIGYFYFNRQEQLEYQAKKAKQDSIAAASIPKPAQLDSAGQKKDSVRADSFAVISTAGEFDTFARGTEQVIPVENEVMKVSFTNKGGRIKGIELKQFKAPDSANVKMAASDFDKFTYRINTAEGKAAEVSNFYFTGGGITKNPDGSSIITFQLQPPGGKSITHQYVIPKDGYMIDLNMQVNGVSQLFNGNMVVFQWQTRAVQLQKDLDYEKQMSFISYKVDGDYDEESASADITTFEDPVNWVSVKQQFFNSTLISKKNFSSGSIEWTNPAGRVVAESVANFKMQLPANDKADIPLAFYYGPTDYKLLKQYGNDMENMVNLGTGIFAFVKYINRWIVLPVFDFFRSMVSNYGIVILLLTLVIRLLISPLTYKSYLSGAKMKVLRPEIEQLKAKHGTDQQAMSMDQMKLFREAGVNPLGGCIPALLQIPIFFALYSFFNSSVALRGENFLWANDLSQYDSIASLPFEIPFYGMHVSLFTLLAVATSFLISIYSMSMTPDQSNPVLKYMPYVFPFILLFIFNTQPAALTWYYTVSNIITLAMQFVIQNYIIDHRKILAKMEENRKKPKTKSKWQERVEQMQEQQKKLQAQQKKK